MKRLEKSARDKASSVALGMNNAIIAYGFAKIRLGTFPDAVADEKLARARELCKEWKKKPDNKPSDWVKHEQLGRLGIVEQRK